MDGGSKQGELAPTSRSPSGRSLRSPMPFCIALAGVIGAALLSACASGNPEVDTCGVASTARRNTVPGVEARLVLPSATVASGSTTTATIELHNTTGRAVEINTVGPLSAVLVRPGTRDIVGGWFGAVGGFGQEVRIDAGGRGSVSVGVPALGCLPSSEPDADPRQFPLPPGTYTILSWLPIGDRDDSGNRITAPEVPITVVPGERTSPSAG